MFSVHLSLNAPNALIQETVRAFNSTWYMDVVDKIPEIRDGYALPPEGIGACQTLLDSFVNDPETIIRDSNL